MSLQLRDILALAQFTLNNPRAGLRQVLRLDLPVGTSMIALALMAVVSALLAQLSAALIPDATNPVFDFFMGSPFRTLAIQGAGMGVTVGMVHVLGRAWGGGGQFGDAVLAVTWLQVFLVILQAGQLLAMLVLPPLATLAGLVSVVVFPWLLSMFVAEVHGFSNPFKVFLGIVVSAIGLSFVLSFLLVALLGPETFVNV